MTSSTFGTTVADAFTYPDRVASTDAGRSCKLRMLDELAIRAGEAVLDLGCGPGTDLAALADAVTGTGAVIGVDHDRAAAKVGFAVSTVVPVTSVFRDDRAADRILGLERTARRAVGAGYFTEEEARRRLDHLADGPFFAAVTLFIVVAEAQGRPARCAPEAGRVRGSAARPGAPVRAGRRFRPTYGTGRGCRSTYRTGRRIGRTR
ncbi:hypothetical protein ACFVFH_31815 [Streptomyces sp. NPDC057697]|uniref:hypothetical protein n=1 Tax=Streptomyces sp. NPDC057697 TaxID=3346219 RepID=UPI0036B58B71